MKIALIPHLGCHGLEDVLKAGCLRAAHAAHHIVHLLVQGQEPFAL